MAGHRPTPYGDEARIFAKTAGGETEVLTEGVKPGKETHVYAPPEARPLETWDAGSDNSAIWLETWGRPPSPLGGKPYLGGEPLKPGEYALAEILDDGLNLFVWDFAVDAAAPATQPPK